jgi:hypothetical protein
VISGVLLSGCASKGSVLSETFSTLLAQTMGTQSPLPSRLDPRLQYLRVEVAGHPPGLLVLGYIDPHPQGEIEVWYSAAHEVIKIQNGRVVGTAGLATDWAAVHFPSTPPAWSRVGPSGATYQRMRDEMPGYKFSLTDQLSLTPWAGLPAIALPASMAPDLARSYRWFREEPLVTSAMAASWYAWGEHRGVATVVYSEQCLSPTLCLKLQRWPVQEEAF